MFCMVYRLILLKNLEKLTCPPARPEILNA